MAASKSSRSNYDRCDPLLGVDLVDVEDIDVECVGPLVGDPSIGTHEDEVARRASRRRSTLCPWPPRSVFTRSVCHRGISTVSDSRVYDSTAIVTGKVVGQRLRHRVPVAGGEVLLVALGYSACRVFQPRRVRVNSSKRASAASMAASSKTSERLPYRLRP